jgi:hypothetical protein
VNHREEATWTIRIEASAEFDENYDGDLDGFAWREKQFRELQNRAVGAVLRALNGGTGSAVPTTKALAARAGAADATAAANRTSSGRDVGSRYRQVERDTLAKTAIKQAGYKPTIAARAVERATGRVPADAPLEVLLKEAFRHCDERARRVRADACNETARSSSSRSCTR